MTGFFYFLFVLNSYQSLKHISNQFSVLYKFTLPSTTVLREDDPVDSIDITLIPKLVMLTFKCAL